MNCTLAFRAQIAIMKPERFSQHKTYQVFYGAARIPCLVWWVMPTDGKNHDKSERKFVPAVYADGGVNYVRPPKPLLKKAVAVLLPLIHYDIEPYKPTAFEKNYKGKIMMMETSSIIGVGRVDRVIRVTAPTFSHNLSNGKYIQYRY